jgi:hypothetical protein
VAEFVIPEGVEFDYGKWADLQMFIVGGRERTEAKSAICCRPQKLSCRKWLLQLPRELSCCEGAPSTEDSLCDYLGPGII